MKAQYLYLLLYQGQMHTLWFSISDLSTERKSQEYKNTTCYISLPFISLFFFFFSWKRQISKRALKNTGSSSVTFHSGFCTRTGTFKSRWRFDVVLKHLLFNTARQELNGSHESNRRSTRSYTKAMRDNDILIIDDPNGPVCTRRTLHGLGLRVEK